MIRKYDGRPSRLKKPGVKGKIKSGFNISNSFSNPLSGIKFRFRIPRVIIYGVVTGVLIAFVVILVSDFQRVKALAMFQPNITTKIYDQNGLLISELFRQKREVVSLDKIPGNLKNAFISIEDTEFYNHYGINIKGIVRAFFINVFSGRIRQGGSTITQQLAKILLTSRKRSIYRKIKEAFIAIAIEFAYTKEEILELYLNQIFLGHGVYGVESASRLYFDKHVWELDLAESALLATLPSSPNRLSPIRHPDRSMVRHRIVLAKMVETGFIAIPDAEKSYLEFWPAYLSYINELPPTLTTWTERVDKAPWFTEHIRRILIRKYGGDTVYQKGLRVYTTLDLNKQTAGQNILKESLENQANVSSSLSFKNEDYIIEKYSGLIELFSLLYNVNPRYGKGSLEFKKFNDFIQKKVIDEIEGLNFLVGLDNVGDALEQYKSRYCDFKNFQKVEGCLISIDHRNGYIEAMVGGSEFSSTNQLNRVMQSRRQPGSAIKPLIYTAAFEAKDFTPATTILDSPIVYIDNEGADWIPENYEGSYYGRIRLRKAMEKSVNVISIKIIDELGIDNAIEYCSRLLKIDRKAAKKRIPRNFSIALGSFEVSPFELARAYAIIANGGRDVIPYSIRYIEDRDGEIIDNTEEKIKERIRKKDKNGEIQIIEPETAQVMISMLKSVISSGTGISAFPGRPAGGKTGTTNNWRDAWFVGFTPRLTTCIWMGYDKLGLSLGIGQSGGVVVAPVWGEYVREALVKNAPIGFPSYDVLIENEVCAVSGLLPSYYCRKTIKEVFCKDTLPEYECGICKDVQYNHYAHKKGPRKNVARKQKKSILSLIKKKQEDESILNDIGDDLLD